MKTVYVYKSNEGKDVCAVKRRLTFYAGEHKIYPKFISGWGLTPIRVRILMSEWCARHYTRQDLCDLIN